MEEDVEKELQLTLQSLHHNNGLITASEDDEKSNQVVEAVHNSESETTKTETDS